MFSFSRLGFPGIRRNLSEMFEHVQNVTKAYDSHQLLQSRPTESLRVSHYMMSLRRRRRGGHRMASQAKTRVVRGLPYARETQSPEINRVVWEGGSQKSRCQSNDMILCDYPLFHIVSDLMHCMTNILYKRQKLIHSRQHKVTWSCFKFYIKYK